MKGAAFAVPVASLSLACCLDSCCSKAEAQAIGPDCVNSSLNDIARHGTNAAGTIIGYSSGNITCNRGDMPMAASPNSSIRPMVGMNMYRFVDNGSYSRFEQMGQGWAKWVGIPINGTNASCGPTCQGGGSGTMGVNCADTYSSGFNSPGGMAPRSAVNATLGSLIGSRGGGTGEANINTRVQVLMSDIAGQPASTRYFYETIHLLPDDATYVRPGQTVAFNAMNNATSQELLIGSPTALPSMVGTAAIGTPAIARWAALDDLVTIVTADHDDTPNPRAGATGTFVRSRFHVAGAVTPLAGGLYRYEYAVFNLNSDRSAGSVSMHLPASATLTDTFFRHPPSHSGQPYSNDAWDWARSGDTLTVSTQSYTLNANANAIRWGTMYNFGFTTNVPPADGAVTLGLFKPGALASISATGLPAPGAPTCVADVNDDDGVDVDDLVLYMGWFEGGVSQADLGGPSGSPDGGVDVHDLLFFLVRFELGC